MSNYRPPSVQALVDFVRAQCVPVAHVPEHDAYDAVACVARSALARNTDARAHAKRVECARAERDQLLDQLSARLHDVADGTSAEDVCELMSDTMRDIYAAFTGAGVLGAPRCCSA